MASKTSAKVLSMLLSKEELLALQDIPNKDGAGWHEFPSCKFYAYFGQFRVSGAVSVLEEICAN